MNKLFALTSLALICSVFSGCEALQSGGFGGGGFGGPGGGYGGGYGYPVFQDPYPYDHGYWEGVRAQERIDWERERVREEQIHDIHERQREHDLFISRQHAYENQQRQSWEHTHAEQIHNSGYQREKELQQQRQAHQEIAKQHQEIENKEHAQAAANAQHQREIRERQIRDVESHHDQ